MQIIGAGFGRTGTLSLKHALEALGFAPCYHMTEAFENAGHIEKWQAVVDGEPPAWDALLGNYQAGVDVPVSLYYKELMAHYPAAKVVLSVRDADRWYESVAETIYQMRELPRWMERLPRLGGFLRLTRTMIWEGFFSDRFTDRAFAMAQFERHNAEVRRTVPAERLLVYSVKEGWAPLCEFLNVPVPDKPFPHVNDRADIQRRINVMHWISRLIPLMLTGGGAAIIWRLSRRFST